MRTLAIASALALSTVAWGQSVTFDRDGGMTVDGGGGARVITRPDIVSAPAVSAGRGVTVAPGVSAGAGRATAPGVRAGRGVSDGADAGVSIDSSTSSNVSNSVNSSSSTSISSSTNVTSSGSTGSTGSTTTSSMNAISSCVTSYGGTSCEVTCQAPQAAHCTRGYESAQPTCYCQ